ncbi:MAG: hypothetical protein JNL43_07945 [Flavobacteriales bacterium]|nr:hypothetical protein [Flavobacteriales bacterium]
MFRSVRISVFDPDAIHGTMVRSTMLLKVRSAPGGSGSIDASYTAMRPSLDASGYSLVDGSGMGVPGCGADPNG